MMNNSRNDLILEKFSELAALDQLMLELYRQCENNVDQSELKEIFTNLIADEANHIEMNREIIHILETGVSS